MDMKDRVDNFLKVAKERILETEPNEVIWDFNDLYTDLRELVSASKDQALLEKLNTEWDAIWFERKTQKWDETFLETIAGESDVRQSKYESLQKSLKNVQGGSNALWSTNTAPNTMLTTASIQKSMQDIVKAQVEQQYQQTMKMNMKDRYSK